MNRKTKIILGITIPIVLLLITILVLLMTKVIDNPFLDTSNLVCSRENIGDTEEFYFEFNWLARVKTAKKTDYFYFETEEETKSYYDDLISENIKNIKLKDKTVIVETNIFKAQISKKETRKKLKNNYTDFGFKCK